MLVHVARGGLSPVTMSTYNSISVNYCCLNSNEQLFMLSRDDDDDDDDVGFITRPTHLTRFLLW